MIKSKLLQLYQKLSTKEKRQFNKWLRSPIHNQHTDVTELFNYINSKRKISKNSVSKEKAFQHLYKTQEYNDNRMRHIMSFALDTLENFVSYSQTKKDNFLSHISLEKGFRAYRMEKMAEKQLKQIKKEQEKKTIKDSRYYLQNYEVEKELFEIRSKLQRTERTNLQEITSTFTTFFIINTLKYACKSKTHSNLRKEDYEIPLLEAVLEEAESGKYDHVDTIMQYFYSYKVLTEPEKENNYEMLKEYLFRKSESTSKEDFKEIYIAGLNYCIRKLNDGAEEFVREALLLYQQGLKKGILTEDGILSRFSYKNITALALRCKEYDWTEEFIEEYATYIEESHRNSYQHYNRSKLEFERGNTKKAFELLTQVEYDDIFLNLDAKVMLMKIYYKNEDTDSLDSLIDSMNVYLRRKSKQVLSYHKENYNNIIRFTQKIIRVNPFDSKSRQILREEIELVKPLTERKWLLGILNTP